MRKYLVAAILSLVPLLCQGQAKLYTKGNKFSDFTSKTTKIVLGSNDNLNEALQLGISSRWRLSPFDFCTEDHYKKNRKSDNYYFIHQEMIDGVTFLVLSRGGVEGGGDPKKEAFDVFSMPVCSEAYNSESNYEYMDAMVDIMQQFIEDVLESPQILIVGLNHYNKFQGRIKKNPCQQVDIFSNPVSEKSANYTYIFNSETHELYSFRKTKQK